MARAKLSISTNMRSRVATATRDSRPATEAMSAAWSRTERLDNQNAAHATIASQARAAARQRQWI